jgi:DNA-binding response OmpR family regulator
MPAGRILVIAPDDDLRGSIAFALSAHGYAVTVVDAIANMDGSERFDCTVLDEAGRPKSERELADFATRYAPVLLLAFAEKARQTAHVAAIIDKPLRGEAVLQAVHAALGGAAGSATT